MILERFSLKGKVAMVTGASTGLGQGMSVALAEAGASVVGVDYVDCEETKAMIEDLGARFHSIKANLMGIEPVLPRRRACATLAPSTSSSNAGIIGPTPSTSARRTGTT